MWRVSCLKVLGCLAGAALVALAGSPTASAGAAHDAAGHQTVEVDLLCGYWSQTSDRQSGQSSVHHFSAAAAGEEYSYTLQTYAGQTCKDQQTPGGFQPSSEMFSWNTTHASVDTDPRKELGTEHGLFTLTSNGTQPGGFNGRISDYDVNAFGGSDGTPCGDGRTLFYSSGHHYDIACPEPTAPGNFNTHGGADTGQHYRGTYGTILYQDPENSGCPVGSRVYCFESILIGQIN